MKSSIRKKMRGKKHMETKNMPLNNQWTMNSKRKLKQKTLGTSENETYFTKSIRHRKSHSNK